MPELLVEAVILDMDGVLVDTGDVYARHWRRWGARHGVDYAYLESVQFGRPAVETIRLVAPQVDAVAEAALYNAELVADGEVDGVVALPGAHGLLAALPAGRWGIATSAPRAMAPRWLARVGLAVPTVLVTVDDVARGKPAPDPYLRAAELLGVEPARCLVIEDAPAGITAARAAGASVLAVTTTHDARDLGEADSVVGSLGDVAIDISTSGDEAVIRVRWPPSRPLPQEAQAEAPAEAPREAGDATPGRPRAAR